MRLLGRAKVVGITRARSQEGAVLNSCRTGDEGRAGAVVVDVGTDQHQALQRAERKVRAYGKALLALASLLCLSVCGNLVSSAVSLLVFKEFRGAILHGGHRSVVLFDSNAATPVDTPASVPGLKRCAVAASGPEACWELADPAMTEIPDEFMHGNSDITGTLRVGPAVNIITAGAFANSRLTGLDLSKATSLVEIRDGAFSASNLEGMLVIPANVTKIGKAAFQGTKLSSLDLSKAISLVSIGDRAFSDTGLEGTLVIPANVAMIGPFAFAGAVDNTKKLTGLDLSKAASLVEIGDGAFSATALKGTLVIPATVRTIGVSAFQGTRLMGLDLSKATSLVQISAWAFYGTDLQGTLMIPATLTVIGDSAFQNAKLTRLNLSEATALVEIGDHAFYGTGLEGTLVIPAKVTTIGPFAFAGAGDYTKLTGLDLSKATSLVEIRDGAFSATNLEGTLVIPANVTMIGNAAFQDTKLSSLDLSKAASLVSIGSRGAFSSADLLEGKLVIPATTTAIGDSAFYDTNFYDPAFYDSAFYDSHQVTT